MKTRFFLLCSLVLVPLMALPKDKPVKVHILSGARPASAKGETKLVADWFEGQVLKGIMEKYPCVQVTTASAVKDVLELNRQREMLDPGSGIDLEEFGRALGVNYIISLTVTEMGPGKLALYASMASASSDSAQAKGMEFTSGGEAALDAAEAAAKKFVDGLSSLKKFSKEYCDPTNRWVGTIKYRHVENFQDKNERKAISGEGTVTIDGTQTINHDVTINIPWTGQPRATITANESLNTVEVGKVRIACKGAGASRLSKPVWKSAGWNHSTRMDKTAGGSGEPVISVTVGRSRYEIAVSLPEIVGTTKTTVVEHNDGGCGEPSDKSPAPFQATWTTKVQLPPIDRPLQKPDTLQGSDSDQSGRSISWDLTLTPVKK